MIRRIEFVKNAGIFRDFKWPRGLGAFERLTLIYGPNGSGKTSLARALFDATSGASQGSDLALSVDDATGGVIAATDEVFHRIFVFSDAFVKKNHRLSESEATMSAVITLGQRTIEDDAEIERLTSMLPQMQDAVVKTKDDITKGEQALEKCCIEVSSLVVADLQPLGSPYESRTQFHKGIVEDLFGGNRDEWSLLDDAQYQRDKKLVSATADELVRVPAGLNVVVRADLAAEAEVVLRATPTSMVLDTLREHAQAESWVRLGVALHEHSDRCIFCGNALSATRRREIEGHFSDEVDRVARNALALCAELDETRTALAEALQFVPTRKDFSEQLRDKWDVVVKAYRDEQRQFDRAIENLGKRLRAKADNVVGHVDTDPVEPLGEVSVAGIEALADDHNKKVEAHEGLRSAAGLRIRNHHLKRKEGDHDSLGKASRAAKEADKESRKALADTQERISDLQAVGGSIAPSAETLTTEVQRLLGHDELTFHPAGPERYEVRRRGEPAHRLSEGEVTAITLVHFLEMVRKHDVQLHGKPIVVVDDPVSSLDQGVFMGVSTALWAALVAKQSVIDQMILLTHNFELFRQWDVQWEHFPNQEKKRIPRATYEMKASYEGTVRGVALVAWPPTEAVRKKMRSAYHHAFISVANEQAKLTDGGDSLEHRLEAQLLFPNVIRRLLETFLAFKFPGDVGQLSSLMAASDDMLTAGGYGGDHDALRHNLLRYSNVYSHSDSPATDLIVSPDEILPALNSVLMFMKTIDPQHFDGMCVATGLDANALVPPPAEPSQGREVQGDGTVLL